MARKKESVRFLVTDGVKPNRVGPARVFNLKAPIVLNIPAGASVRVPLGVSCNYPLQVFGTRGCLQRGLTVLEPNGPTLDADTDLVLIVKNTGKETQLIEQSDVLARAFVLDNNDLELE
jgi:hypothetical protein